VPRRPRNRGIQRKEKTIGLSENQLDHLINGSTWPFKTDGEFPFESEEHRRQCWERHREEIFRECQTDDETEGGFHPYFRVGDRPAAWWEYTPNLPKRKSKVVKYQPGNTPYPDGLWLERTDYEEMEEYLDRTELWRTDEKRRYLAMKEREQKQLKRLTDIVDLDEHRELHKTVRKTKAEYED
jgi:hypothetical protein